MVRDGVANIVIRLQEGGFDPHRVGDDAWEARCPAHQSFDHALSITRNEHNHVVLECRSTSSCPHTRIIGALGLTNDHVYAETADWLISRLRRTPIQPATFASSHGLGPSGENVASPNNTAKPVHSIVPLVAEDVITDSDWSDEWDDTGSSLDNAEEKSAECELWNESVDDGSDAASSTSATPPDTASRPVRAPMFTDEEIRAVYDALMASSSSNEDNGLDLERESPGQILTSVASDAKLIRSNDGRLFAQVPVGDRVEIFALKSAAFRDWLVNGYLIDRTEPPSPAAIRRTVGMLEARARFDAEIPEVFVRIGGGGEGAVVGDEGMPYFIDLGDPSGAAVEISDRGWSAVDRPAVHFRRPDGQLPLPMPNRDGSIDQLRRYVNLSEADFRLMVTWLTAVLRPVGPYPILVLNGEQAAAKSTLVKVLRLLIDPHTCIALNPPTSTRNLMATAVNGWLLAYDNISEIPRWMSDALCQLVYGGAISGRALFTNDERSFIYAQRPVLLSGIGDFVRRGDLKDRCVFLQLPPIPRNRRRGEDEFWRAFHADRPGILGAVFDAIAGGLRQLPSVHLPELPRMADYAVWGEAVGRTLGWGRETFLSTYTDNRNEATMTDLLNSPVASAVLQLARRVPESSGTPGDLHARLTEIAGKKVAASAEWPKSTSKFGQELRQLAPQLRLHGVNVSFERTNEGRIISVTSDNASTAPPA